jgi:hypothetical protein
MKAGKGRLRGFYWELKRAGPWKPPNFAHLASFKLSTWHLLGLILTLPVRHHPCCHESVHRLIPRYHHHPALILPGKPLHQIIF